MSREQRISEVMQLSTLVRWLRTRQADEEYDYMDIKGGCLFGQYLTAKGIPFDGIGGDYWRYRAPGKALEDHTSFPDEWLVIAHGQPRTFGAALERAQAVQVGEKEEVVL